MRGGAWVGVRLRKWTSRRGGLDWRNFFLALSFFFFRFLLLVFALLTRLVAVGDAAWVILDP